MSPPFSGSTIVNAINKMIEDDDVHQQTVTTVTKIDLQQEINRTGSLSNSKTTSSSMETALAVPDQSAMETLKPPSKRLAQNVLTRAQIYQISIWIIQKESEQTKRNPSKAVLELSMFFKRFIQCKHRSCHALLASASIHCVRLQEEISNE